MEVTLLARPNSRTLTGRLRDWLQVGVPAKPKPRNECEPLEPRNAFRICAARRRVCGANGRDRGGARRPQCEPVRKRRDEEPVEVVRLSIVVPPFANLSGDRYRNTRRRLTDRTDDESARMRTPSSSRTRWR